MASNALPVPPPLEIHDSNAADKWRKFLAAWENYALATELGGKPQPVQVATLLTVIGEDGREVYSTFRDWAQDGDDRRILPVLRKFAEYCQPRKNVLFERYKFNKRTQESGESYEQYKTTLRKLSEACEFDTITPNEILRDRLIFGIHDTKVRERLLRETNLTLIKTDEICRAAESMTEQMRIVGQSNDATTSVHAVRKFSGQKKRMTKEASRSTKSETAKECWNCGRQHGRQPKELCPAFGKSCDLCGKLNHFANKCRQKRSGSTRNSVRAIGEPDEVFPVREGATLLDDSQCVTLKLDSGNYIRFQIDSGAQCNVLPLKMYKRATKDVQMNDVTKCQSTILAFGGSRLTVVGEVRVRVWRGDYKCILICKLVDSDKIRPILGRKACVGMKLIKYMDNDALHKPATRGAQVYAVEGALISKAAITEKYATVFGDGIGELEGEYRIRLDDTVDPIQHAPRRVPVALRDRLKTTLDDMVRDDIIEAVEKPTEWISSMVVITKKDNKLRICLDPKDLNHAIRRENYQLPTIEDIATRLHGAKVFTVLDVRHGFWHVRLDERSSYLTTFNTPFGRYRYKRMPFGISSAPEVFQKKMHELIEGLHGIEVVADDFVVVGYGNTVDEANVDHDKRLHSFLQRCEERGVKLNVDKFKLRQEEVRFIGHVATSDGLGIDPTKVKAIVDMPNPTDVPGVQRLLGLAQYLAKFLPHLSDITKPLRDLTRNDTEWVWETSQQNALDTLKKAVASTPVLRYYNLADEVTIQCDASQSGLGAALMQNGQPVAYASRALTPPETRYAQIEKELLAIVFACDRFEAYIYGRDHVTIESDHKPLEMIVLKPLSNAPKRLQRMLLQLQKYTLDVKYKKGEHMYLADTLSRAYIPEVNVCDFVHELEELDHRESLPVSQERWQQLNHASENDNVCRELRATIQNGWPGNKSEVPECVLPYYDSRDELTIQGNLIFKGQLLVVPAAVRTELISVAHASHIGIEGCLRRMRECLYWPRMTTQVKDYLSKCEVCLSHRSAPPREPLQQHDFVARPWSKIGADLCQIDGRTLLVVCDYYSNFIEVARLNTVTTRSVLRELLPMFARFGLPDVLVSDNGPQFASAEFAVFMKQKGITHVTSSPHYAQSNGKAENAVKTLKLLFAKAKQSGESEYMALLDWRNTPSEGMSTSPAQRLMGRRCKTLLPTAGTLLKPRYDTDANTRALAGRKRRQSFYYNQHARPLTPIDEGATVRMRLPGEKTWTPGTCTEQVNPRSYRVKVGGTVYRRNRRQLVCAGEDPRDETSRDDATSPPERDDSPLSDRIPETHSPPVVPDVLPDLRRSVRERKPPARLNDYVSAVYKT